MIYTVIGVWQDDTPIVVGLVAGSHDVQGGDRAAFPDGLWAAVVEAADVEQAEPLAVTAMRDNLEHYVSQPDIARKAPEPQDPPGAGDDAER